MTQTLQNKLQNKFSFLKHTQIDLATSNNRKEKTIDFINKKLESYFSTSLETLILFEKQYVCEDIRLRFYNNGYDSYSPHLEFVFSTPNSPKKLAYIFAEDYITSAFDLNFFPHENIRDIFFLDEDFAEYKTEGYFLISVDEENIHYETNWDAETFELNNEIHKDSRNIHFSLASLLHELEAEEKTLIDFLNLEYSGNYRNFIIEEIFRKDEEIKIQNPKKYADLKTIFGEENIFGLMFPRVCCYNEQIQRFLITELF